MLGANCRLLMQSKMQLVRKSRALLSTQAQPGSCDQGTRCGCCFAVPCHKHPACTPREGPRFIVVLSRACLRFPCQVHSLNDIDVRGAKASAVSNVVKAAAIGSTLRFVISRPVPLPLLHYTEWDFGLVKGIPTKQSADPTQTMPGTGPCTRCLPPCCGIASGYWHA